MVKTSLAGIIDYINREENEASCWQFVVFGIAAMYNVFIAGITEKEWMEPIGMNE